MLTTPTSAPALVHRHVLVTLTIRQHVLAQMALVFFQHPRRLRRLKPTPQSNLPILRRRGGRLRPRHRRYFLHRCRQDFSHMLRRRHQIQLRRMTSTL